MFKRASHFKAGDITQINARSYHDGGSCSSSHKTEIHTKEYHHHGGTDSDTIKDLYAYVAAGCINDSDDRVDAPKCHEETRKAVQGDVFSWMDDGPPDEILWLTGPAGSGKSAIMGTVSDKLKKKGMLAATFFFAAYAGTVERTSKRGVVTTLAYQLQRHPDFEERISTSMMAAIRRDPAVFKMSLQEQMEVLILLPLRKSQGSQHPVSTPTHAILIDGVDECGEGQYNRPSRSRQDDQIEVLSVLQQATKDPAFPFRIVVASRPETWIRSFFTNVTTCTIKEIFLDDKYSPDDDIRLFLQSKFAELCRRYGIDSSVWPTEAVIDHLVRDASGQFIYVMTVLRFIDTPPHSPQEQLKIVLRVKPKDRTNPFSVLDALYTSILLSSPNPSETVTWLRALEVLGLSGGAGESWRARALKILRNEHRISAWTTNCLLESSSGQAKMLLGLPSLIHTSRVRKTAYDTSQYGNEVRGELPVGWNAAYAFYHKSFLDYLQDPLRCGAAFPGIDRAVAETWIGERCTQTLVCGGPQVPVDPELLLVFQRCFLDIVVICSGISAPRAGRFALRRLKIALKFDDALLSTCEPRMWLNLASKTSSVLSTETCQEPFPNAMADLVHRNCVSYLPCTPGCKLWRGAINADAKRRSQADPNSP